jgi:hypothetical protein
MAQNDDFPDAEAGNEHRGKVGAVEEHGANPGQNPVEFEFLTDFCAPGKRFAAPDDAGIANEGFGGDPAGTTGLIAWRLSAAAKAAARTD